MNFSWFRYSRYRYANYSDSDSSFIIFTLYIKTELRLTNSEDTDQTAV